MFKVKANTQILVQTPKSKTHFYWSGWMGYTTKEDKIYDKGEVWDAVTIHNNPDRVPEWARKNIIENDYTVLSRGGKFAMVQSTDIEYLD